MTQSQVYFTSMRTQRGSNLLEKLERLVKKAGIEALGFRDKYTAIKIHLGEPGNLGYLRPNYTKVIVDLIRANGGKAFLTDCNTLYVGRRKNALDHLEAAYENGFNPFATGCHVIIADGLKGTDETLVPVHGDYIQNARIGRAVMDADIIVSMTHFKGHESTGFGGVLKNLGMGCGSQGGKMEMHCSGKPVVRPKKCRSCGACIKDCGQDAISYNAEGKAVIDQTRCVGCGRCLGACHFGAISVPWDEANDILNCKIAEYTKAVLAGRPSFHISFVVDVSPACDCMSSNDVPIIADVGIFASFDPVALDMACVDAVNRQPVIVGSKLGEKKRREADRAGHSGQGDDMPDHFGKLHPETNWRICLEHAEKIGVGSLAYELVEV